MRHLARNASLVLFCVIVAVWAIIPPEKKLRKGKDLAGGVSVVYQVDVKPGEQSKEIIDKVIQVVHERLDPKGLLEISIVAEGNNRINFTMPLPSPEAKQLSADFEAELARLSAASVDPDELERDLALPADQRREKLSQLARSDPERLKLFEDAAAKHDAVQAAVGPYNQQKEAAKASKDRLAAAEAAPDSVGGPDFVEILRAGARADEAREDELAKTAAEAGVAYDKARDEALASAVSPNEVRRVLKLSKEPIRVKGEAKGEWEDFPSPRQEALDQLIARHKGAEAQIRRAVAAWERYESKQSTLSDPNDLIRMLKGAGVLNFRILVPPGSNPDEGRLREQFRKFGPTSAQSEQVHWYKINKIQNHYDSAAGLRFLRQNPAGYLQGRGFVGEMYDGEYYVLLWDRPGLRITEEDGQWRLADARQGTDKLGRPGISFTMDRDGATKMGSLTENNVGARMAILLDDELYTAPTLNDRIAGSGIIEGNFDSKELNYIIKVLSAGSLQAKLGKEPISSSVLAPELGADNLHKGLMAGVVAFFVCAAFMITYYFYCGVISVFGLMLNGLFIVGAMALQGAPFTLPGIAGVVLTFGQAIDANVLIYERMREEIQRGLDLKSAVRLGYEKARASIVDGNVTHLIVCVVLGSFGTQEIKGFATTLGLGIVMTLFTQLFVTRILFTFLVDRTGIWKKVSMLPIAVPALDRALSPRVDWMKYRYHFMSFSILLTGMSIAMVIYQSRDMLDNEFRGGTKVTMQFRETAPGSGKRVTLTRPEVKKKIEEAARSAEPQSTLRQLETAEVVVVNPENDKVTSDTFSIKTTATDQKAVQDALIGVFSNVVDAEPKLAFKDSGVADARSAPTYPIVDPVLGKDIDRPGVTNSVADYLGGIAIVLDDIHVIPETEKHPVSAQSIEARLSQFRSQPDFQGSSNRTHRLIVTSGSENDVKSAVLVVKDPSINFQDNEQRWASDLQAKEWTLVNTALAQATTLARVESFSSAIAQTFRAKAVNSIAISTLLVVMYVWIRFGSLRYSLAAIVCTLHDCIVAVGAIAFAEVFFKLQPTWAETLGILPFRIDLNLVAAILTLLGYSLNDTIIVMDRIRENKGKLPHASRSIINDAINQTISRTVITSGTTLIAVVVLYVFGGEAVRGFAYAMLVGVVVGTYSSIAVAAPLVWSEEHETHHGPHHGRAVPATGLAAATA